MSTKHTIFVLVFILSGCTNTIMDQKWEDYETLQGLALRQEEFQKNCFDKLNGTGTAGISGDGICMVNGRVISVMAITRKEFEAKERERMRR